MDKDKSNFFFEFFNWQKNPENVFYLALPIGIMGFLFAGLLSIVKLNQGDPWYLVITLITIIIFSVAVYPALSGLREIYKNKEDN